MHSDSHFGTGTRDAPKSIQPNKLPNKPLYRPYTSYTKHSKESNSQNQMPRKTYSSLEESYNYGHGVSAKPRINNIESIESNSKISNHKRIMPKSATSLFSDGSKASENHTNNYNKQQNQLLLPGRSFYDSYGRLNSNGTQNNSNLQANSNNERIEPFNDNFQHKPLSSLSNLNSNSSNYAASPNIMLNKLQPGRASVKENMELHNQCQSTPNNKLDCTEQVTMHVKNLDYKISSDEWERILTESFRKHCKDVSN